MKLTTFPIIPTPAGAILVDRRNVPVALVHDRAAARLFSLAPMLLAATEAALPLFYREWQEAEQAAQRAEDPIAQRQARRIADRTRDVYCEALAALILVSVG